MSWVIPKVAAHSACWCGHGDVGQSWGTGDPIGDTGPALPALVAAVKSVTGKPVPELSPVFALGRASVCWCKGTAA